MTIHECSLKIVNRKYLHVEEGIIHKGKHSLEETTKVIAFWEDAADRFPNLGTMEAHITEFYLDGTTKTIKKQVVPTEHKEI